jgi:hypothetical protein
MPESSLVGIGCRLGLSRGARAARGRAARQVPDLALPVKLYVDQNVKQAVNPGAPRTVL